MRILLTGGSGMVGRNFLEHSKAKYFDIYAPSRLELDLLNFQMVLDKFKSFKPDFVVHTAGLVGGIQANINNPVAFLVENLDLGRNVILAAKFANVPRLLNLGSSCMYPRNAPNPLREETILSGTLESSNEGYALAKIVSARLCEYVNRENSFFSYKTLIPCNLYGKYDRFNLQSSHLVPAIIIKVFHAKLTGADNVEIWGSGKVRREFMFAADLADCMFQALEKFDSMPTVMNVGLGQDRSVLEYYKLVADIVGFSGKFVHNLEKPEGMEQKLVSVDKLTEWGWSAATSINEGLEQTFEYYLKEIEE